MSNLLFIHKQRLVIVRDRLPRIVSKSERRKLRKKKRLRRERAWDSLTNTSSKIKTFDDLSNKQKDVSRWLQSEELTIKMILEMAEKRTAASAGKEDEKDFRKVLESMETRSKKMEQLKTWTRRVYKWWKEIEKNEKMKLEEKLLSRTSIRLSISRELIETSSLPLLQMPAVRTSLSELKRTYKNVQNLLRMNTLDMPVRAEQLHFENLVCFVC